MKTTPTKIKDTTKPNFSFVRVKKTFRGGEVNVVLPISWKRFEGLVNG